MDIDGEFYRAHALNAKTLSLGKRCAFPNDRGRQHVLWSLSQHLHFLMLLFCVVSRIRRRGESRDAPGLTTTDARTRLQTIFKRVLPAARFHQHFLLLYSPLSLVYLENESGICWDNIFMTRMKCGPTADSTII